MKSMPMITLTSDWGLKDPYLPIIKGLLLSKLPGINLVDISHEIPPFNTDQAAYILRCTYPCFPPGTIHILAINTEESDRYPHTVIRHHGQFFIGTDNGIFSLIFDEKPEQIIELDIFQDSGNFTFSTRDRFVSAAIHLANDLPMEQLGTQKKSIVEKMALQPVTSEDLIKGHVIYIDAYENVITNISNDLFRKVGMERPFTIIFRSHSISRISQSYSDVTPGEILALFNTGNLLEIAMNNGNAATLLGLDYKDLIRIEFTVR
ncbi:MAG: SAM-dependent chlorinase/fluorinase [Bacteroidales bacterium]|nr:SAM-dependent chlorinase/fluorinase [Bacteroidales bacterium]